MTTAGCTSWGTSRNPLGFTRRATEALLPPGHQGTPQLRQPCRAAHLQQLQPHQLQALPLEPPDDLPDQVSLDPVWFDGHEGAFIGPAAGCGESGGVREEGAQPWSSAAEGKAGTEKPRGRGRRGESLPGPRLQPRGVRNKGGVFARPRARGRGTTKGDRPGHSAAGVTKGNPAPDSQPRGARGGPAWPGPSGTGTQRSRPGSHHYGRARRRGPAPGRSWRRRS